MRPASRGIRLIVKGPLKTAKRAAARHGVPVRCHTEESRRRVKDTVCDAPCNSYSKLVDWYAETPSGRKLKLRAFAKHPDGSLLFFNPKDCAMLGGSRRRRRR